AEEQARRLQARIDNPRKQWKFRMSDLEERKHWDAYQVAYEEAIRRTASRKAPWIVVPANRKWHRDLVICRTLVETLEGLDLRHPPSPDALRGVRATCRVSRPCPAAPGPAAPAAGPP